MHSSSNQPNNKDRQTRLSVRPQINSISNNFRRKSFLSYEVEKTVLCPETRILLTFLFWNGYFSIIRWDRTTRSTVPPFAHSTDMVTDFIHHCRTPWLELRFFMKNAKHVWESKMRSGPVSENEFRDFSLLSHLLFAQEGLS